MRVGHLGEPRLRCDRCGEWFWQSHHHLCPEGQVKEHSAEACVNCKFYRPIDHEVRQEGQCYLVPPVLSPQTENPWVRPNVRWSDVCGQYQFNHDLEVSDA